MTDQAVLPTQFINCLVTVTPSKELPGEYDITSSPSAIKVVAPNTVISYQISPDSPSDVKFINMSRTPGGTHQLSVASISLDGQLLTFIDGNTVGETLHIYLTVEDDEGVTATHDPQILNEPQ